MEVVTVSLEKRAYDIILGSGAMQLASDIVSKDLGATSALMVTHPMLYRLYGETLCSQLAAQGVNCNVLCIPPGERHKNYRTVLRLYDAFGKSGLDRSSVVVALGGGVLGDVVGFAAATWLRGIRYLQIPTTLLAQVDSSVGGKTGIDLPSGKNLVGAFHQPSAVLADTDTLRTLPKREMRSGMAEIIKYGIIADETLFMEIESTGGSLLRNDSELLLRAIKRSCEIKADIVRDDETEQGRRAILNFGHTIGHALETSTNYRRWRHGEAISLGMIAACRIGESLGVTPEAVSKRITALLSSTGLPVIWPRDIEIESIIEAAGKDKKHVKGVWRMILVSAVGDARIVSGIDLEVVRMSLSSLCCETQEV